MPPPEDRDGPEQEPDDTVLGRLREHVRRLCRWLSDADAPPALFADVLTHDTLERIRREVDAIMALKEETGAVHAESRWNVLLQTLSNYRDVRSRMHHCDSVTRRRTLDYLARTIGRPAERSGRTDRTDCHEKKD